jgi:Recombinase
MDDRLLGAFALVLLAMIVLRLIFYPERVSNLHVDCKAVGIASLEIQRAEADRFAANMLPIVRSMQSAGPIGMASIANELNGRCIRTPRGARWHVSSVANILARANELDALR